MGGTDSHLTRARQDPRYERKQKMQYDYTPGGLSVIV
jgi:hypothetical protein